MKRAILAVTTMLLASSLAVAHPGSGKAGHNGRGGEAQFGRMAEKLNLSDVQKQQMNALRDSFRASNAPLFEAAKQTRLEMREAREAGDDARVDALHQTLQSQHQQLRDLRMQQHEQMITILTPEQRAQMEAMKAEREARCGDKRGRKGGDKRPN